MSPAEAAAVARLNELSELGMAFARRLDTVSEGGDLNAVVATTEAFCAVTRSIRQSIMLAFRIERGLFPAERTTEPGVRAHREPDERPERLDGLERLEGYEYERPDWNIRGLRLDEPLTEDALEAAVTHIRRSYARAEAVLTPRPANTGRAGLLNGTAALRLVDSS